jgi:hypothetical protein
MNCPGNQQLRLAPPNATEDEVARNVEGRRGRMREDARERRREAREGRGNYVVSDQDEQNRGGVVPLDDPSRPRNRSGGPVSEERAQAARYVMEKIIRPSLPKIIGESLPRGAAKQAEAADPLDSLKTAFLALDGRARSRFRD